MGYHRRCDWCDAFLGHDTDFAEMPVKIQRRRRTRNDEHWAEEARPTRFFCVAPEPDREGQNRMGLPEVEEETDSCYDRAIRAIVGTKIEKPDMGMEWRLVPVGAEVLDAPAEDAPEETPDIQPHDDLPLFEPEG